MKPNISSESLDVRQSESISSLPRAAAGWDGGPGRQVGLEKFSNEQVPPSGPRRVPIGVAGRGAGGPAGSGRGARRLGPGKGGPG